MSASLVGSEMCIRDSHRIGRARSCLKRASSAESTLRALKARLKRCMRSVSYTHLTLPTICSV
eukprot:6506152-Alexandrium_andersonii.AAC.1